MCRLALQEVAEVAERGAAYSRSLAVWAAAVALAVRIAGRHSGTRRDTLPLLSPSLHTLHMQS